MRLIPVLLFLLMAPGAALAQNSAAPKVSAVTTVKGQVPTLKDYNSPDAGKRWRVHPVSIGHQWLTQVQNENHTRVLAYRNMNRTMTLSILNASMLKAAHVRIFCGENADAGRVGNNIFTIEKSGIYGAYVTPKNGDRATANCMVTSDIPVHVAAVIEDTIAERDNSGYGGLTLSQDTTIWPAFRLTGP